MSIDSQRFDFAVIGAGIAGASVAAQLAGKFSVILLERESHAGYHSTGRSAALFSETYGPEPIRALARASREFLFNPDPGFCDGDLVSPRGVLMIAHEGQMAALDRLEAEIGHNRGVFRKNAEEARSLVPLLRRNYIAGGIFEADACDIDVNALHQGFLRQYKSRGGIVHMNANVSRVFRDRYWKVRTESGTFEAETIINASGAWSDEIAALAGARTLGLVPKRRTVLIVDAPAGFDGANVPMAVDIDEKFYLKPETGRLLASPADETPSPPCDAQPEEIDIAVCVERIEKAFDLSIRRILNRWAGLRTFSGDKVPVVGWDPELDGFFWLAGQGGYGIQTAPAMARLAASLLCDKPSMRSDMEIDVDELDPARFAGEVSSHFRASKKSKHLQGS